MKTGKGLLRVVLSALAVMCLATMGTLWGQGVAKVGKAEAMEAAVTKVNPEYPAIAKQLRLEGVVDIQVTIAEDGSVSNATIASGNPILGKAAVEALHKWKFKPFKDAEGKATKANATLAMSFKL